MVRRLPALVALAAALTACSDKGSNGGDPVAWAEKVCKSVDSQIAVLTQLPNASPSDPVRGKESLLKLASDYAAALDRMVGDIRSAGAPPVTDGSQVVDKVTNALQDARKAVESARGTLEKAQVTDVASFQKAYTTFIEDLSNASGFEEPTKDLKSNAQLNDAFNKAPTCQKLDGETPSTPPSR